MDPVRRPMVSCPLAASIPLLAGQLALDYAEDQFDDVWIGGNVDPAFAVALIPYQAREFELAQVMADGRQALPGVLGERSDILAAVGQQPKDMNTYRRGQHREHTRRVLEQLLLEWLRGFVVASRWGHLGSFRGWDQPPRSSTIVQVFECPTGAVS
jgi:hypothetical protein